MAAELFERIQPHGGSQWRMQCDPCNSVSGWTRNREHAQIQVDGHNQRVSVHENRSLVKPTQMQYVIVTAASNGVVHAWGTYDSRREAINAKNRMKTQVKRDYPVEYYPEYHEPGAIKYHICQINDKTKR